MRAAAEGVHASLSSGEGGEKNKEYVRETKRKKRINSYEASKDG